MVTLRQTGHRIRAGTQAVVDVTSAYEVKQLAVQNDQSDPEVRWILSSEQTTPPERARRTLQGDLSVGDDGFYTFQWHFSAMTLDMWSYWLTSFLPSGVLSAAVTVMTYDDEENAVYLTCKINKPPAASLAKFPGGYPNVVWPFTEGVIIT